SVAEFAMILPVLMLLVLGIAQLGLIMQNAFMMKYAAYMTARVACVYGTDDRTAKTERAASMLKGMAAFASVYGNAEASLQDSLMNYGRQWLTAKLEEKAVVIEEVELENSGAGFVRITLSYDMPLTVPVVNRIFGGFQDGFTRVLFSAASMPYYTIRATSVTRVE
ncbi:MAG: pilus assembly protein, partial [Spirochaetia bacterium]|nr:pilus assembly protein [Spirochaetia bacterium]